MISGSVLKYCGEDITLIENYEQAVKDTSQIWECHHRLEIQGDKIYSSKDLKELGLYWHRPASELILLTKANHTSIHAKYRSEKSKEKYSSKMKGRKKSEEFKKKVSKGMKGLIKSEEHCKNLSKALTGKKVSEETKRKLSLVNTGKKLSKETRKKMSESRIGKKHSIHCLEEIRKKFGNGSRGKKWFNNGIISVLKFECPEGFKPGRK